MKEKMVHQYKCDFCGKKKYSKSAMKLHELHCTMNPARDCRTCNYTESGAAPLSELKELLVPYLQSRTETTDFGFTSVKSSFTDGEIAELRTALHEAANGCPVCMLAAIRQSGLASYDLDWDYDKAGKEFWDAIKDGSEYGYY